MLRETLGMALDSVRGHKFRSFLTVLGIVIGVMTAICIASILTGMRQNIVSMIEEYGTNNIYAFHLSTGPRTGEDRSERTRKPLTVADAETIKAQAPAVDNDDMVYLLEWIPKSHKQYPGSRLIDNLKDAAGLLLTEVPMVHSAD